MECLKMRDELREAQEDELDEHAHAVLFFSICRDSLVSHISDAVKMHCRPPV